uniref:Calponin-homology (CH) domain-containing protein n=1 Tax=Macrostomum lignano TaxID=282301 RepID=A0A1I8IHE6_9PLAT
MAPKVVQQKSQGGKTMMVGNAQKILSTEKMTKKIVKNKESLIKPATGLTANDVQSLYGSDIACMAEHLNALLKDSSLAAYCLPLDQVNVFSRLYEGVLQCAVANLLQPGAVDPAVVNLKPASELEMLQNRNLGLASLRQLGLCVSQSDEMRPSLDRPFRMTPLLVQILRLVSAILATEREKILQLWVNYQLRKEGTTDTVLKDFGAGLADSSVYARLLWVVAPLKIRETLHNTSEVIKHRDFLKRAQLVVSNAEKLGIKGVINPEHIADAGKDELSSTKGLHNNLINAVFLYRIFQAYPNIDEPKVTKSASGVAAPTPEQLRAWCKCGASEETLVWEAMIPGCVRWSNVKTVNEIKNPSMRLHTWAANCEEVIKCADKAGINRSICSATDIVSGHVKSIAALVFLMMRLHSQIQRQQLLGGRDSVTDLDDSGLVEWFNSKLKGYRSDFQLKSME